MSERRRTIARARRAAARTLATLVAATVVAAAAPSGVPDGVEAPVADAAMRRDTAKVRLLLKQGADVNAAQGDGMTALHWVARAGGAGEAQMLVSAGARLDAVTRNGNYTALHLAARAGNAGVVQVLLAAGADVAAPTSTGGALPLHLAAAHGNAHVVAMLLDAGATVDARERAWGQTPIMWAAAYDRIDALTLLARRGADLKATSKVDDVAARERADRQANTLRNRRIAALKAAEQPPRPANAAPAKDSAALAAARKDSTAGSAGAAKPDAPVDSAAKRSEPTDTVRRGGGGINSAQRAMSYGEMVGGKGGLTPLLFAVRQGHADAVDALLAAGADINQVSAGDSTSPLLMAAINGHFDIAKRLLARGADPKLASTAGATPLYAAINVQWAAKSLYPQPTAQTQQQSTHLELVEALLKAGADPNARLRKHLWYMSYNFDLLGVNTEGATPFWRATYGLDLPAMKLLLAHGADPKVPTRKPAGQSRNDDDSPGEGGGKDQSGLPPVPAGGPAVYPIHAASGVGYGEGFAANSHRHAPDAWIPTVKFLIEELGADVNARDHNGYTPLHHAAARGDNALIDYLVSKGGNVMAVSRSGQTTADMANGPVQRVPPFVSTVQLLETLGSKNNHKCKSC